MKPTFKIHRETGRYASFSKPTVDIKLKKKVCGSICFVQDDGFSQNGSFRVRLMITKEKTEESPSRFQWVTFKARFEGVEHEAIAAAKVWTVENWEKLTAGRELYFMED